jgi:hypothetical protein
MDVKLWVLTGTCSILLAISSWLAINLYNTNQKRWDQIEKQIEVINNNQINLSLTLSEIRKEIALYNQKNDYDHSLFQSNIDNLSDVDATFWRLLITDPTILGKQQNKK